MSHFASVEAIRLAVDEPTLSDQEISDFASWINAIYDHHKDDSGQPSEVLRRYSRIYLLECRNAAASRIIVSPIKKR